MLAEDRAGGVRHGVHDDEVAQSLQEVLREPARVVAALDHAVDDPEHRRGVGSRERLDGVVEQGRVGEAEQPGGVLVGDAGLRSAGHQLVQDAHRVADGAAPGPHHQRDRAAVGDDAFLLADLGEVGRQLTGRNQAERVVVHPRADGRDDLLRLGRGEDELHVRRRLLDHLEQRVGRPGAEHVRLVDDVDLVARRCRGEVCAFAQVTGVVDQTVGRRVDLDDVEAAAAARCQCEAGVAGAARSGRRTLRAVEAAGHDPRTRRLAAPPRAGEQVRVVGAVGLQRLLQGTGHVVLADHLGEGRRPVAAVERLGHGTDPSRRGGPPGRVVPRSRARGPGTKGTPRTPARACLPLLPSGPGGVQRDDAARGVGHRV